MADARHPVVDGSRNLWRDGERWIDRVRDNEGRDHFVDPEAGGQRHEPQANDAGGENQCEEKWPESATAKALHSSSLIGDAAAKGVSCALRSTRPVAASPIPEILSHQGALAGPVAGRIVVVHPDLASPASRHRAAHFFSATPDELGIVPAHAATLVRTVIVVAGFRGPRLHDVRGRCARRRSHIEILAVSGVRTMGELPASQQRAGPVLRTCRQPVGPRRGDVPPAPAQNCALRACRAPEKMEPRVAAPRQNAAIVRRRSRREQSEASMCGARLDRRTGWKTGYARADDRMRSSTGWEGLYSTRGEEIQRV